MVGASSTSCLPLEAGWAQGNARARGARWREAQSVECAGFGHRGGSHHSGFACLRYRRFTSRDSEQVYRDPRQRQFPEKTQRPFAVIIFSITFAL